MQGGGGMPMMWLGSLIPLVLVLGLVWSVGRFRSSRPTRRARSAPGRDAREVLDHRFATGEIDEAEFRARRDTLGGQRS